MKLLTLALVWILSHQVFAYDRMTMSLETNSGYFYMYRAKCDNGKWMDWDTAAKRDAEAGSFCKSVGSSLKTATIVPKDRFGTQRPDMPDTEPQSFNVVRKGTSPNGDPIFKQTCDDGTVTNHKFNTYTDAVVTGAQNCKGHDRK